MPKRELTDPLIVNHARKGLQFFISAGDDQANALGKAITAALAKQWRKKPLDMTNPRNAVRYGKQFTALESLVLSGIPGAVRS